MVGIGLGLGSIPFYTLGVLAPELVRGFGWSFAEVMGGFTVMTLVTAVAGPLARILADRLGVRPVAVSALVLFSLGFMSFALMNGSVALYFLTWALVAALGAGNLPATWTRGVAGAFHRHRGLALCLSLVGSGHFAIAAKPLVAAVIANIGWRGAYVVLGALPLWLAFLSRCCTSGQGAVRPSLPHLACSSHLHRMACYWARRCMGANSGRSSVPSA